MKKISYYFIYNSLKSMEMRFLNDSNWNHSEPLASSMTKSEIIKVLEDSFDHVIATIGGPSEASLSLSGKQFGNPRLNKEHLCCLSLTILKTKGQKQCFIYV